MAIISESAVLYDNYARLARRVVATACLDYIALNFPRVSTRYLKAWYRICGDKDDMKLPYRDWLKRERKVAVDFLEGKGRDIAILVDMDGYIQKARKVVEGKRREVARDMIRLDSDGEALKERLYA